MDEVVCHCCAMEGVLGAEALVFCFLGEGDVCDEGGEGGIWLGGVG